MCYLKLCFKLEVFCSQVLYIVRYVWKYNAIIYFLKLIVWELLDQVVTMYILFITIQIYAIQLLKVYFSPKHRSTFLSSSQLKLSEKVNKDNYAIDHYQ